MSAQTDVAVRGTRSATGPGFLARAGGVARSSALWVAAAIVVLIAAIVTVLVQGGENTAELHYESTEDGGGRAFVEVLSDHGRDLTTTESYGEAGAALDAGETLVVYAAGWTMSDPGIEDLSVRAAESGARIVLIAPEQQVEVWTDALLYDYLGDGSAPPARRAPNCGADVANTAGTVRHEDTGSEYFSTSSEPEDSVFCYGADSGDVVPHGVYAQVPHGDAGGTVTVMGSAQWFANGTLAHEGHMSLVAGAVGTDDPLTYYYPVQSDQPGEGDDGEAGGAPTWLFPAWAVAALLWSLPVVLVALLVYGRRLGPLAVEPLPVIVPAAETVRGRSALLQRSQARAEGLADLRAAALVRIGRRLALPPDAPAAEVVARAAAASGLDPAWAEAVLLSEHPHDDETLIRIAIDITTLESEVTPP
ncbi:DUF4350 domain-containing protein [Brevibacterium jeotgali]|uniref:DUF4350 domain-containing protein n=1 Tax=Brevibacterium jeotgali TaxID=1262550 RepID=A0A2H1L650_9MICO|nr:DUF4350 domain-containing protein [Brevibacterium jeotgali]TWC03561.1 hypothetical protein FB108_2293 [Brevibacterium jeotgali]SMY12384.1 hypothetical protein BJEO58_01978 [Brevibacterium jeotgali]